ncbi:MAG: 50S ribosomal protein L23 [Patescibacteria group bacterium]|jgi:large subunit ribosomal protein L23|nr:50S ribosomal protein L23 [Patescibacteria group bacterium]MDD3434916.1 50S ribosomal protein L23 [Patescibacteria group bacterium]MDD4466446.1 50S ribosomal protein L23 [Patescibacteria group bacterium]
MGILGKKKDEAAKKTVVPEKKEVKEVKAKATPKLKVAKKSLAEASEPAPTMADLYADDKVGKKIKSSSASGAKAKTNFSDSYKILSHPLITEKAATNSSLNKYVFIVSKEANKVSIAKAVYAVYGVKPMKINIVCQKGKAVTRGRIKGQRSDFKKAIVTLKKGDSIQIYEGV